MIKIPTDYEYNVEFKTKLPFTHGIETENHLIVRSSRDILVGENLLTIWNLMFDRATQFLKDVIRKKQAPQKILRKIKKIEVTEEEKRERRLKFIWITYQVGKKTVRVNVFGPDPNISQITWLLELVTPPCEFLEELDWWIDVLYSASLYGLKTSIPEIVLLPLGLNPLEKRFRSGLSCGTHHHIGIPSKNERIAVYNMYRNFVPHLIGLTASSPFISQKPSGKVIIRQHNGKKQIIGRYTHSHRISNNTGQIGPNIPEYLPILSSKHTRKDFEQFVKKMAPDDRMVDIYPFTDYDTIELRFFDAQPWIENRLAIVLLLQALALKATKIFNEKIKIPSVSGSSLFENRQKSIELGLLAQFTPDLNLSAEFSSFYNFDLTTGKKSSKLIHSMKSMLIYLKDELKSFNIPELINYLLIPVLGSKDYAAPYSIVEHLIGLYEENDQNIGSLMPLLYYSEKIKYPISASGDLDSLKQVDIISAAPSTIPKLTKLSNTLQNDLTSRKLKTAKSKKKTLKSIKTEEKLDTKKERIPLKKPIKQESLKSVPKQKIKAKMETKEVKTKAPAQTKKISSPTIVKEPPKDQKKSKVSFSTPVAIDPVANKDVIISAFDEIDEVEIFTPAIDIEPKYAKIESRIANVMRKRREELEVRTKQLYQEHLEQDRAQFKPTPKISLNFPSQVSGEEVFGYIIINWDKKVVYKLRNNTIIFYLLAIDKKGKETKLKNVSTVINTSKAFETGSSKIPLLFYLSSATGDLKINISAVTSTNKLIFVDKFEIRRADEISIIPKEFYITGNYGLVETVYQAENQSQSQKGEVNLYLTVQSRSDPISIYSSKFNLKNKESVVFAKSIELSPLFHHSPFYLVSELKVGRFKKTRAFKAITINPLKDIIVEWDYTISQGKANLKKGVNPKTKYEIDFVFHFNKELPPLSITIFINTLPEGRTQKLVVAQIKRNIDPGDEYIINKVKFKTPKNCGYLYFEVEIRTEEGIIPVDLISEPIGVPSY